MKNKQAFTLIELLVVVLIIGILAAVALPQYQKAVKKARLTAVLPVLKSLAQAEQQYYLAHGSYAPHVSMLDIQSTGLNSKDWSGFEVSYPDHPYYSNRSNWISIATEPRFVPNIFIGVRIDNGAPYCGNYGTAITKKVCQEFFGDKPTTSVTVGGMPVTGIYIE